MMFVSLITFDLVKAIFDQCLVEFLNFYFQLFFVHKNVTKILLVPLFEPKLDMLYSFVKEVHFLSLELKVSRPPFFNVTDEIRVGELDILEYKGPILGRNGTFYFQLNRTTMITSEGKDSCYYFFTYKHNLL